MPWWYPALYTKYAVLNLQPCLALCVIQYYLILSLLSCSFTTRVSFIFVDVDDIQTNAMRWQLLFNNCLVDSDLLYFGGGRFLFFFRKKLIIWLNATTVFFQIKSHTKQARGTEGDGGSEGQTEKRQSAANENVRHREAIWDVHIADHNQLSWLMSGFVFFLHIIAPLS